MGCYFSSRTKRASSISTQDLVSWLENLLSTPYIKSKIDHMVNYSVPWKRLMLPWRCDHFKYENFRASRKWVQRRHSWRWDFLESQVMHYLKSCGNRENHVLYVRTVRRCILDALFHWNRKGKFNVWAFRFYLSIWNDIVMEDFCRKKSTESGVGKSVKDEGQSVLLRRLSTVGLPFIFSCDQYPFFMKYRYLRVMKKTMQGRLFLRWAF